MSKSLLSLLVLISLALLLLALAPVPQNEFFAMVQEGFIPVVGVLGFILGFTSFKDSTYPRRDPNWAHWFLYALGMIISIVASSRATWVAVIAVWQLYALWQYYTGYNHHPVKFRADARFAFFPVTAITLTILMFRPENREAMVQLGYIVLVCGVVSLIWSLLLTNRIDEFPEYVYKISFVWFIASTITSAAAFDALPYLALPICLAQFIATVRYHTLAYPES